MRSSIWLLLVAALFFAVSAGAAETLVDPISEIDGCQVWMLCDAEESAQNCGGAGNERYIRPNLDLWSFTAWANESTEDSAWTIKFYETARGMGYDATWSELLNSAGDLTPSNLSFVWTGHTGDIWAVIGGTHDGDLVSLRIRGCPLAVK